MCTESSRLQCPGNSLLIRCDWTSCLLLKQNLNSTNVKALLYSHSVFVVNSSKKKTAADPEITGFLQAFYNQRCMSDVDIDLLDLLYWNKCCCCCCCLCLCCSFSGAAIVHPWVASIARGLDLLSRTAYWRLLAVSRFSHHSFTLSLQAQNLPFQQILPTVDFFYLLGCLTITGLDRTYHAHQFILLVSHFNFFLFRVVDYAGYPSAIYCTLNTHYRIVSYIVDVAVIGCLLRGTVIGPAPNPQHDGPVGFILELSFS